MTTLLNTLVLTLQTALAGLVGYLLMLTAAALRAPRQTVAAAAAYHRFLILVPAHNEEKLLPTLLQNLAQLDYPAHAFAIHVVADNCTDGTARVARDGGAVAHERFNDQLRGKGYALQWLLHRLWASGEPHEAVIILDADSLVSTNFLQVMNARLNRGERAVQAYYAVHAPEQSNSAALRYAALTVLHFLRPQGRMVLGGSAGLKGNGMMFAADLLRHHEWSASLTEDIEFHMQLILAGERVTFAPDAVVWAEMPDTLAGSHTQNARWERGRIQMIRTYVPSLLRRAGQERNFVLFDAAMEQIIPPFSILAGLSALGLGAAALLPRRQRKIGLWLGLFTVLGQVIYLFTGLWLARAPRTVYKALLGVPRFLVWKIWLYLGVLRGQETEWIRTKRN